MVDGARPVGREDRGESGEPQDVERVDRVGYPGVDRLDPRSQRFQYGDRASDLPLDLRVGGAETEVGAVRDAQSLEWAVPA